MEEREGEKREKEGKERGREEEEGKIVGRIYFSMNLALHTFCLIFKSHLERERERNREKERSRKIEVID